MIEFKNLSFTYTGLVKPSLKNINLKIQDGETILLLGASGCGKTTITRFINGLIPGIHQGSIEGAVFLDGVEIPTIKTYELAKQVGSVFQNPKSQFFNTDVHSELGFGLENEGYDFDHVEDRIQHTVGRLKINNLLDRDIFNLSGGEKQLIAFGSVYAMEPNILVLDEPSANLDVIATDRLRNAISMLKSEGKTIIIAEHRLYYLTGLVDRVVYMREGEIIALYSHNEMFDLDEKTHRDMGIRALSRSKLDVMQHTRSIDSDREIICCNLSKKYRKQKEYVFYNENYSITKGTITALVGNNGSGKTTFVRCLSGLLTLNSGKISVDGKATSSRERIRKTYIVMQDCTYQLFTGSVLEECQSVESDQSSEQILAYLEEFDLIDYLEHHPQSLSGGQKQRLSIVLSLLMDKEIVIFDEPTSGLDYHNMLKVANVLKKMVERGRYVILISHDIELLSLCSEICTLDLIELNSRSKEVRAL